jgi:hypothetical protein
MEGEINYKYNIFNHDSWFLHHEKLLQVQLRKVYNTLCKDSSISWNINPKIKSKHGQKDGSKLPNQLMQKIHFWE